MKSQAINEDGNKPKHVAIIMDGNGRWARSRGLPRTFGHKKGAETVRIVVESALKLDVEYLTLFGFSSENWNRPKDEVIDLMSLLRGYLFKEVELLDKKGHQI
jgi:undecaprenyl diphosphate synthase